MLSVCTVECCFIGHVCAGWKIRANPSTVHQFNTYNSTKSQTRRRVHTHTVVANFSHRLATFFSLDQARPEGWTTFSEHWRSTTSAIYRYRCLHLHRNYIKSWSPHVNHSVPHFPFKQFTFLIFPIFFHSRLSCFSQRTYGGKYILSCIVYVGTAYPRGVY